MEVLLDAMSLARASSEIPYPAVKETEVSGLLGRRRRREVLGWAATPDGGWVAAGRRSEGEEPGSAVEMTLDSLGKGMSGSAEAGGGKELSARSTEVICPVPWLFGRTR